MPARASRRLSGSLRERDAEETWRLARRLMRPLGIQRVTDITRIDRLGWPVFASVRPRGRTLAVHAGKGLWSADARIGALMEAIELAVAEADAETPPEDSLDWGSLQRSWPVGLSPALFAPQWGVPIDPQRRWPCLRGEWIDTASGRARRLLLPAEPLRLHPTAGPASALFPWSSNGLASGNSAAEATLHALLELLERDTLALHAAVPGARRLEVLPAVVAQAAAQWQDQGVQLLLRELPNEFGLPCFSALLVEEHGNAVNLAEGSGLHTDRGIALVRAVSEAAQSRLSTLHGGRDDIVGFYGKFRRWRLPARRRREAALVSAWRHEGKSVVFGDVPHRAHRTVTAALRDVRLRLAQAGFPVVLRHQLPWPAQVRVPPPLAVVRLAVPGLEMLEPHNQRIGPRLARRLMASPQRDD